MDHSAKLSKHFKAVHFGGNWSDSNLKEVLIDVTLEEALTKIGSLNTILALTFHLKYYVDGVLSVLEGGALTIRDKFSYDHPDLKDEHEWQAFLEEFWEAANRFGQQVGMLNPLQIEADFSDPKYGDYFSNILGIIEHQHYHLGQIVLLKKLIRHTPDPKSAKIKPSA